ncbi:YihY/virulence factor BrkB family protein [Leadbetterella sp. DM7]|uniref:YihY/virulence factor BrkB family protein n=1 Tax=Leadbetterella sp. DM7 TaxID=3235085 RepID=UPI00349EAA38
MRNRIKKILAPVKNYLSTVHLFGSDISVYRFLEILWSNIVTFDLDQRATSVAFSFLLAVFPAILFLFTLIPYIPIDHLDIQIMDFSRNLMPEGLYDVVAQTIYEIISRPRGDILSFGFIFSLYAATNGINSLTRAFNGSLEEKKSRGFVRSRGTAALVLLILVFVLVCAVIILIVGKIVLNYLAGQGLFNSQLNLLAIHALGYISIFFIFYFGIASLYYFAPAIHKRIRFFNFGAVFASVLCILATNLFSYYLENFSSYNKLYGSIGTLIAIMVWIYLICLILILGFEINVDLRQERYKLKGSVEA